MLPVSPNYFTAKDGDKNIVKIDHAKLRKLEADKTLTPGEKVNILLILLGRKWICEVGINNHDSKGYSELLGFLGLPFRADEYDQDQWITVGANKAVLHYLNERREVLSEIEAGVLYGYPVTHTLGFTGILKSKLSPRREIQDFFLGGVYSNEYFEDELAYFDKLWKLVHLTSPEIARQAEDFFVKTVSGDKIKKRVL